MSTKHVRSKLSRARCLQNKQKTDRGTNGLSQPCSPRVECRKDHKHEKGDAFERPFFTRKHCTTAGSEYSLNPPNLAPSIQEPGGAGGSGGSSSVSPECQYRCLVCPRRRTTQPSASICELEAAADVKNGHKRTITNTKETGNNGVLKGGEGQGREG